MDPQANVLYDSARLERPSTGSWLTVTVKYPGGKKYRKLTGDVWEEYVDNLFPGWNLVSLSPKK